jgi:hypothetical protein
MIKSPCARRFYHSAHPHVGVPPPETGNIVLPVFTPPTRKDSLAKSSDFTDPDFVPPLYNIALPAFPPETHRYTLPIGQGIL